MADNSKEEAMLKVKEQMALLYLNTQFGYSETKLPFDKANVKDSANNNCKVIIDLVIAPIKRLADGKFLPYNIRTDDDIIDAKVWADLFAQQLNTVIQSQMTSVQLAPAKTDFNWDIIAKEAEEINIFDPIPQASPPAPPTTSAGDDSSDIIEIPELDDL